MNRVITCAHVVEAATGIKPCKVEDPVDVYYPKATGATAEKTRTARVAACFDAYDDDVVLLTLDAPAPIGPEQIAELGYAELSANHAFRAYGYKYLTGKKKTYQGGYAYGTVMGCVECPPGFVLQADPVELDSPHLASGMSGAGVLDTERNLVVGLVSEVYYAPDDKNRDVGWAVDAQVLTFDPLNLPLAEVARPKETVEEPPELPDPRLALLRPTEPMDLHGAPPVLEEWVGRADLLAALTDDWRDPDTTVTALVGFGGEGKSSLARQWLDTVLDKSSRFTHHVSRSPQSEATPDGAFWWSFYNDSSIESFFEALLEYLGGGRIDTRQVRSASARMKLAARMLRGGRYLLVLDGFEVMQQQEGDDYGLVKSTDLRAFLEYLAAPKNETFTLITSRAPLLDLLPYTTATQRDVTRLSRADGRALLRALGVKGHDSALDRVVRQWDGHALTLSLLGSLLAERYDGDLRRLKDLPAPTEDEDRYQRVHRVLRRYDEHLTEGEREFLKRFSAFRTPVAHEALERICTAPTEETAAPTPDSVLPTSASLRPLIDRLLTYRILRYNQQNESYTTHPLIRNHYFALFTRGEADTTQTTHTQIKDYYLELAGDTPRFPTLDDLRPLIEVVHHACRAGAYDEADNLVYQRIYQGYPRVLVNHLGAWETALNLMHEFFPRADGSEAGTGAADLTADPQVSDSGDRRWILNEVGLCLMSLGRLREAAPFYERHNAICLEMEDWHNASGGYQNLAELQIALGELDAGAEAAREALRLARKAENQRDERNSLAYLAWAEHLRGKTEAALAHFAEAEALEKEIDSRKHYLYSLRGIQHADTLIRCAATPLPRSHAKTLSYARHITEANLEICERNRWAKSISQCHRVLGDLDAHSLSRSQPPHSAEWASRSPGAIREARAHYDEALRIARSISERAVLIEALLGRGRYLAKDLRGCANEFARNLGDLDLGGLDQALSDLREALELATRGGYRRYEADIRVALAWAHLTPIPGPSPAGRGRERARAEAARARALSEAMGYHWGQIDAAEVLERLEATSTD